MSDVVIVLFAILMMLGGILLNLCRIAIALERTLGNAAGKPTESSETFQRDKGLEP